MSDDPMRLVVLARYADPAEAGLAANLLRRAGLAAALGEGATMPGFGGPGGFVSLEVRSADAPRAAALLAEVEALATLDDDWEDQAEAIAVCSLCGVPLEGDAACPACATPRDAIQAAPGRAGFTGRRADIREQEGRGI